MAIGENGVPMDHTGMPCADIYNRHTGTLKEKGSGNRAAIRDNYRNNGRPGNYVAQIEKQELKEEFLKEKRENKRDMKAQLREDSKLKSKTAKKQTQANSSGTDEFGNAFDIENSTENAPRVKSKIETLQEQLDTGEISDKNLRVLLNEEAKELGTSKLLRRVSELNSTGEEKHHVS